MRTRSTPSQVGDLLETALPRLREPMVVVKLQRRWPGLVGQEIARRAQPVALTDGILQIAVDNSPWLQELSLREAELLHRIEGETGPGSIRGLRFVLHSSVQEAQPREVRQAPRSPSLTPTAEARVEEALTDLHDDALVGTVKRFLGKAALAERRARGEA